MDEKHRIWVVPLLRTVAIVMALNKQTKTMVVATIGSTMKSILTAKFQHTPSFVFFVIANGIGSIHNLFMLEVEVFGNKFNFKGLRLQIIPILDMMIVALVSAVASSAAFMGELGRNGSGALITSFVGILLLMTIREWFMFTYGYGYKGVLQHSLKSTE